MQKLKNILISNRHICRPIFWPIAVSTQNLILCQVGKKMTTTSIIIMKFMRHDWNIYQAQPAHSAYLSNEIIITFLIFEKGISWKFFYICCSPFRRKKIFHSKNLYNTTLLLYFLHIMNHFSQQRFIELNVSNIMLMASFWVYFTLVWIQRHRTGKLIIQFYERCQNMFWLLYIFAISTCQNSSKAM